MSDTVSSLLEVGEPTAPALVVPDGESLTYSGLVDVVQRRSGALSSAGVRAGDRVAIVEPDGREFLILLFAALALGATVAPLNAAYTESEFAFYLEDIRPRLLVLSEAGPKAASEAATALGVTRSSASSHTARVPPTTPVPDDVALLLHTSGTTSRPKQVPLRHRNLVSSARTIAASYRLSDRDVAYCAMPLFHVHGLVASVFATLASGGSVVLPGRFTPRGLLEHLGPYGVTWYSAGPTVHTMVLERDARTDGMAQAPRLRFIRSCSSALSEQLMAEVERRFDVPLLEAYGMTEASHQIASNPLPPGLRFPGSVGVATGTEIAVRGPDGGWLTAGEVGEVVVRGAGITSGYLDNPDANAESFIDGWFRTGDLGALDGDGYLRLAGRIKEMVIRGGENISPYEVEDALTSHPAVREAACFGLPDAKYGEAVAAVVSLSSQATAEEIREHCRERIATFKVPATVHIVEAIPRTATGKIQRQRLPALLGLVPG